LCISGFDTRTLAGSGLGRIEPQAPTLVKHGATRDAQVHKALLATLSKLSAKRPLGLEAA